MKNHTIALALFFFMLSSNPTFAEGFLDSLSNFLDNLSDTAPLEQNFESKYPDSPTIYRNKDGVIKYIAPPQNPSYSSYDVLIKGRKYTYGRQDGFSSNEILETTYENKTGYIQKPLIAEKPNATTGESLVHEPLEHLPGQDPYRPTIYRNRDGVIKYVAPPTQNAKDGNEATNGVNIHGESYFYGKQWEYLESEPLRPEVERFGQKFYIHKPSKPRFSTDKKLYGRKVQAYTSGEEALKSYEGFEYNKPSSQLDLSGIHPDRPTVYRNKEGVIKYVAPPTRNTREGSETTNGVNIHGDAYFYGKQRGYSKNEPLRAEVEKIGQKFYIHKPSKPRFSTDKKMLGKKVQAYSSMEDSLITEGLDYNLPQDEEAWGRAVCQKYMQAFSKKYANMKTRDLSRYRAVYPMPFIYQNGYCVGASKLMRKNPGKPEYAEVINGSPQSPMEYDVYGIYNFWSKEYPELGWPLPIKSKKQPPKTVNSKEAWGKAVCQKYMQAFSKKYANMKPQDGSTYRAVYPMPFTYQNGYCVGASKLMKKNPGKPEYAEVINGSPQSPMKYDVQGIYNFWSKEFPKLAWPQKAFNE